MKKEELYNILKTSGDYAVIKALMEEQEEITDKWAKTGEWHMDDGWLHSQSEMEHYAIEHIKNGNYDIAMHILLPLTQGSDTGYYLYDTADGRLSEVQPIDDVAGLIEICGTE